VKFARPILATVIAFFAIPFGAAQAQTIPAQPVTLLNVSYDPTREFYVAYNALFASYWKKKTGQIVSVNQSHGGSGAQARAVIEGLDADVVTLGASSDIDAIAKKANLLPANWQTRLPYDSSPYTSTVVLVVRKGNPKHIKDWDDLVRPDVSVITANPKTGAGARWNFLAAYAYALRHNHNDATKAQAFVSALYKNVPVLDSGARGSTTTFVERGIGDVLIAWENEAYYILRSPDGAGYKIVTPSTSILAQPPVAWLDVNDAKHGTQAVAQAYLKYLYSVPAQKLACKYGYRPVLTSVLGTCGTHFDRSDLFSIATFGGWPVVQPRYFGDGGLFDQLYQPK
jgi:sulfate/thiosulfate-binding protein